MKELQVLLAKQFQELIVNAELPVWITLSLTIAGILIFMFIKADMKRVTENIDVTFAWLGAKLNSLTNYTSKMIKPKRGYKRREAIFGEVASRIFGILLGVIGAANFFLLGLSVALLLILSFITNSSEWSFSPWQSLTLGLGAGAWFAGIWFVFMVFKTIARDCLDELRERIWERQLPPIRNTES